MDHLCCLWLVFVMLSRLVNAALWSPAGVAGLLVLVCGVWLCFCHFPVWCPGSGVELDVSIPDLCRLLLLITRLADCRIIFMLYLFYNVW